jgi:GT2 family glycosyltransferase
MGKRMIDFSDISIILHCRIDNEERGKNAKIIYEFYNNNVSNANFIFVEDDVQNKLFTYVPPQPNIKYILTKNGGNWEKTKSYNRGAKISKRKFFCFLDLDIIVHPKHIVSAVEQIKKDPNSGIVLGYNGQSIYLEYEAKRLFEETPTYERLECFIPREWLYQGTLYKENIKSVQDDVTKRSGTPLNRYKYCTAPNSQAVGGCVITNRDKFFEYKGFNPNFTGWGYEDNEIVRRVHKLGYNVIRINGPEALLFHFPHDSGFVDKSNTPDHVANHKEVGIIEEGTREQILEYIKTWSV